MWQLKDDLKRWIDSYNSDYLHSALGYKSPEEFDWRLYPRVGKSLAAVRRLRNSVASLVLRLAGAAIATDPFIMRVRGEKGRR